MALPIPDANFASTQGTILSITDVAFQSEKNNLVNLKLTTSAAGAGENATIWLQYNPIFFKPDFRPKDLADFEGGEGLMRAYVNSWVSHDPKQTSTLLGIVGGNRERFDEIGSALQAVGEKATPDDVIAILKDFLVDREYGREFLTILRQTSKKVEDAEGNVTWRRTPWFSVDNFVSDDDNKKKKGFFPNTAKGRASQIKRAASSKIEPTSGKPWFVVTFDEDGAPLY